MNLLLRQHTHNTAGITNKLPINTVTLASSDRLPALLTSRTHNSKPQIVVYGDLDLLLRSKVAFGGLDGGVAEQEFDLFDISAILAAEPGAGGGLGSNGTVNRLKDLGRAILRLHCVSQSSQLSTGDGFGYGERVASEHVDVLVAEW